MKTIMCFIGMKIIETGCATGLLYALGMGYKYIYPHSGINIFLAGLLVAIFIFTMLYGAALICRLLYEAIKANWNLAKKITNKDKGRSFKKAVDGE